MNELSQTHNNTMLALGGGVDSSTLVAIDRYRLRACELLGITLDRLNEVFPSPRCYVFSDTGAEAAATYRNIEYIRGFTAERLVVVRKDTETITEMMLRLGTVPVMPGASHVCSLKFKGEVMDKWAKAQGIAAPTWIIGIEANEGNRANRFTAPKKGTATYLYPLITLGLTRAKCCELLVDLGWHEIPEKSSCIFCPFKSEAELRYMRQVHPEDWALCEKVEARFQEMSAIKHQLWIDAGKPLTKGGKAPRGMWRKDSWKEGARLFGGKKIDGRRLSMQEWAKRIDKQIASDWSA